MTRVLDEHALAFIAEAAGYLEHPPILLRLADALGRPVEWGLRVMPGFARRIVDAAVERALRASLRAALTTLPASEATSGHVVALDAAGAGRRSRHVVATAMTGAVGGAFGLVSLPFELPATTVLMMRSIAAIAQGMGEDLADPATRLECLTVFSLGGPTGGDDAAETSYYAQRIALGRLVNEATRYLSGLGAREIGVAVQRAEAPALVRLITRIAARFDVTLTEKGIAQAVPILGAVGGATINAVFTRHFNEVARFHFGLRRLEREHGQDVVQAAFAEAAAGPVAR